MVKVFKIKLTISLSSTQIKYQHNLYVTHDEIQLNPMSKRTDHYAIFKSDGQYIIFSKNNLNLIEFINILITKLDQVYTSELQQDTT